MQQKYGPGSVILGRYVIERPLGEGGMGAVYVARHIELERKRFAVKTLRPEVFGFGEVEQRFRQEAQVLGALDHPGIVSITDYGMDGRVPVMVMELLQGATLREHLARVGPLPLPEVVRIIREVAGTLDYTHRFEPPVIHRDLKPENLFLVQPGGRLKVLDFGIAKWSGMSTSLTMANTTMGTPQYMSPEQLRDASKVDFTTDIFALASIAYELLTGTVAYPGEGIAGVVDAIFDPERPRVGPRRPDVPAAVDAVLDRAWALERRRRFASAVEFAEALSHAAALPPPRPLEPHAGPSGIRDPQGMALLPTRAGVPAALVGRPGGGDEVRPRASRPAWLPLLIGTLVALASVAIGGGLLVLNRSPARPPAPAPPSPTAPGGLEPRVTEPVLPPRSAPAPQEPVVPARGASAAAAGPATQQAQVDPFDVVRAQLEPRVRACIEGAVRDRRVDLEITWTPDGFPTRVAVDPAVPPAQRPCISSAVTVYGRVPAQSGRQRITRRFSFAL